MIPLDFLLTCMGQQLDEEKEFKSKKKYQFLIPILAESRFIYADSFHQLDKVKPKPLEEIKTKIKQIFLIHDFLKSDEQNFIIENAHRIHAIYFKERPSKEFKTQLSKKNIKLYFLSNEEQKMIRLT